jgi:hypothetical protein
LVRELASMFRTRIELKQIGVRDEAKRLDGIGRCGRQYCSASWLPELRPVNLGVAKDQRLSLNPSQISGACGRLMCCLRYEHEFYAQSRKRFPKEGKVLRTKRGEEKLLSNDIFRERVTLRGEDGEVRTITLAELRAEAEAAGAPLAISSAPPPSLMDDDLESEGEGELVTAAAVEQDAAETDSDSDEDDDDENGGVDSAAPGAASTDEEKQKKPHRRRGRRGGRRNRSAGRGRDAEATPETPPAGSAEGTS